MMTSFDISQLLKKNGIKEGDNICLHTDAIVTHFIEGESITKKMDNLLKGFRDSIGKSGTLVLPTFSYSSTKNEIFDPKNTPSQNGIISEYFRKKKNVIRSSNPIFSVAVSGLLSNKIKRSSIIDCFGANTCFDIFFKHNFWIITLGCSFDRITFIHYVEQSKKVSYRYFKEFNTEIKNDLQKINYKIKFFVRDLNRDSNVKLDKLKERLINLNLLAQDKIGRIEITSVKSVDFFNVASEMIDKKENIHIKEGNNEI